LTETMSPLEEKPLPIVPMVVIAPVPMSIRR
jgi:hypothetical protein